MAWLRSACVVSGALSGALLLLACREQPEGVVLLVQGVDKAEQLWLTVGTDRQVIPGLQEELRFKQHPTLSHFYEDKNSKPFRDGDTVLLDRPELMEQDELAIVLDAMVKESGSNNEQTFLRAAYAFDLQKNVLNEVELLPGQIGPGQWICAGRLAQGGDRSFAIVPSEADRDCDRDGWRVGADPDDADPIKTGKPKWERESGFCSIEVSGQALPLADLLPCAQNCPEQPTTSDELQGCFDGQIKTRCKTNTKRGRFKVSQLVNGAMVNPNWELVRLGPEAFTIVFAPSFQAPDSWSVEYSLPDEKSGFFVLHDRGQRTSTTVIIDFESGATSPSCAFEP